MLRQGRMTHKHTQSAVKQVQRGKHTVTHKTGRIQSTMRGPIMAGQDRQGTTVRVEKRRRENNGDIMASIRVVRMREQCGREKEASPEGGETDNLEIICGTGRGRKITLSGQGNRRHNEQQEDMKAQSGEQGKGAKHKQ